jgi:uroporphyrinogen-III synthase
MNGKLQTELTNTLGDTVRFEELSCIVHADGEDFQQLSVSLEKGDWDYVAVTSPEAARVLAQAWKENTPDTCVVAVGKATQATLEKLGIAVDFCPSKATAATLVEELPAKRETTTLLYPASAKAASTLEEGLKARGFDVTRLNTYDTVTASWTDDQKEAAANVHVACFGSPSAIEGWLLNTNDNIEVLAACIGETSAKSCRAHKWPEERIFFPEKPGIQGWAASVKEALETIPVAHT